MRRAVSSALRSLRIEQRVVVEQGRARAPGVAQAFRRVRELQERARSAGSFSRRLPQRALGERQLAGVDARLAEQRERFARGFHRRGVLQRPEGLVERDRDLPRRASASHIRPSAT